MDAPTVAGSWSLRGAVAWLRSLGEAKLLALLGLVAAAVAFGAAVGFAKLTETVWRGERDDTWDLQVHDWALRHRTPWLTGVYRGLTDLGSPVAVVSVTVAAVALLVAIHRPRLAVLMAASTVGAGLLVFVVKQVVGRVRPASVDRLVTVSGPAFPSGHAAQSIACYGALAVVLAWLTSSTALRVVAALGGVGLAVGIGTSRVYLGVHWPSDVVAGWLLAASWLSAIVVALVVHDALRRRRAGDAELLRRVVVTPPDTVEGTVRDA